MGAGLRTGAAWVLAMALGPAACSSDPVAATPCAADTRREGTTCVPVTPNGDGGADAAADGSSSRPSFAGVSAVAPASTTSLLVTWNDAVDGQTPPARMRYAVFTGRAADAIDFGAPIATTAAGAAFFQLVDLPPATRWFVAVRAVDEDGLTDDNAVSQSAMTVADTSPPQFAGAKSADPGGSGAVVLRWNAASDDLTPAAAIVYDVWSAQVPALPDLLAPPKVVTRPGALTAVVDGLGDPMGSYAFVVRARDAAGNLDSNTTTAVARAGADTVAPQFAGCATATATSAGTALVTWAPATDDATPAKSIGYDVFASKTPGAFDFSAPSATATGDASVTVFNLTPGTTWSFVCRARDASGNRDANLVTRSVTTAQDASPPAFLGSTTTVVDSSARTVAFTWAAATDDQTTPAQIVYDVFEATAPGAQVFSARPRATSAPGATALTIADLTPDATLYWVVRARDLGGNRDANTVESSGTTLLSFHRSIQPIFTFNCAVVGCHVPGDPASGLNLAQGFAHASLYNRPTEEYPSILRVKPNDPDASYLYLKISKNPPPYGWQMPAPATGGVLTEADKTLVRRWILQGALDN